MRTRKAQALKSKRDFNMDGIRTVRLSITGSKEPVRVNEWAARMFGIKNACRKRTDEEVNLYACMALTSWESR